MERRRGDSGAATVAEPMAVLASERAGRDICVEIANALMGVSGAELGRRIARSVEAIGGVLGADHCVLVEFSPNRQVRSVTGSLGAPAVLLDAGPALEWDLTRLHSGSAVIVATLDELPPTAVAERGVLLAAGVTGAVIVPLGGPALRGTLAMYYASRPVPDQVALGDARVAGFMLLEATSRRRSDAEAAAAEARARAFVEHLEDVVALVRSRDGVIVDLNPAVERAFGIPRQQLLGQPITTPLLAPCDPDTLEPVPADRRASNLVMTGAVPSVTQTFAFRRADGRWAWARQVVEPVDVGGERHVVITVTDITAQREADRLRERSVLHDPISGIPTRRLLEVRLAGLAQAVRAQGGKGGKVAVVHVRLVGFDGIVDRLGHERADEVLATLVREISRALPTGDVVARLSSDELGVVARVDDAAAARELLRNVLNVATRPVRDGEGLVPMEAFGGVGLGGPEEAIDGTLFRRASAACRSSRLDPDPAGTVWNGTPSAESRDTANLEDQLARGVEQRQFELHFQPIVRLDDRVVIGAEALLRWRHPNRGLLFPASFLDVAESSGLIVPIGEWCLEEVCRRFVPTHPDLTVAVNISARQLGRGLADYLRGLLNRTATDPDLLLLELTESSAASTTEHLVSDLNTIRAMGVRVGLDDFGTGHSPLTYLQDLRIDFLKIDRSFVKDSSDPTSRGSAIVGAVLALAHQLDLATVAEGVEDEACAAALLDRGARLVQGYLFGRPTTLGEFSALVERDKGRAPSPRRVIRPAPAAAPEGQPRLVASKLTPPSGRSIELRREALLQRMCAIAEPIVLVSAPAGDGKSTLVAQWVREVDRPVAWLSLDPEDGDIRRFWLHLATAVERASGDQAGAAPAVAAGSGSPDSMVSAVVDRLSRTPMQVVLDDYHAVRSDEIDESVARLADRLPDGCQLVIVTRHDPLLPLSRWRGRGRLAELREPDLRLTDEEAAEFLTRIMGLSLPAEDIATLADRTEGWIGTLYLAGRAAERSADAHQFVQTFGGSQRAVLGYLMDEVLSGLGDELLRFLRSLAVLDRFTPGLADAITHGSGSAARLRELEQTNLLLIPLDDSGDWYRLHHLLQDALLFELRNTEPQREAALHAEAAEWFSAAGYLEEAVRHAEESGDPELSREMLRRHWLALLLSAHGPFVVERLARLTATDVEDPELAFAAAYLAAEKRQHDRARALLAVVEGPGGAGPFKNGLPSGEAASALLRAHYPFDGISGSVAAARRLPDLFPPGVPVLDALVGIAMGFARWHAGDDDECIELTERGCTAVDSPLLNVRGLPLLANMRLDRGDGDEAVRTTARARRAVDAVGLTHDVQASLVDLAEARLADAAGDTAEARAALARAIAGASAELRYEVVLYVLARALPMLSRLVSRQAAAGVAREVRALLARHPDSGRPGAIARQALETLDPTVLRTLAVGPLSERERRVLRLLIATGLSQPEMAAELGVTLNTMKTHVKAVYRKLGVASRDEARARAESLGLG